MKKYLFVLSMVSVLIHPAFAQEPKNLDLVKQELVRYHDSGEYLKDQQNVINAAKKYLLTRMAANRNAKLAIILDVDDTSLTNYFKIVKRDFSGTTKEIEQSYYDPSSPAIQPTLELYRFAKANGVAVFFITSRPEKFRQYTERNLELSGYTNWNGLIMQHEKAKARSDIENKGYDIVLNISDQARDLKGGYADKMVKMPNPYYQ